MRLSDVRGERTFDVIADVIGPIANIASDKEAAELFSKKKPPEGVSPRAFLLERLKRAVPTLLRGHKSDVLDIMAAVVGVPRSEYAEGLDLVKLLRDCVELVTDEAFVTLFISAQSGGSSASVPASTEADEA